MKRKFLIPLITIFAVAAICLVFIQVNQIRRSVSISNSLFDISVSNAMDDVTGKLNRLQVEDYISQNDRYKLLKYKRIEDLNIKMEGIIQENLRLFYDTNLIHLQHPLQDSALIKQYAELSPEQINAIQRYNTILGTRNKLTNGSAFYDQFVNELSEYVVDKLMTSNAFNYELLDTLIIEKLNENGVDILPDIGIFNTQENDLVYSSNKDHNTKIKSTPYRYSFSPNGPNEAGQYYILLSFPKRVLFLRDDSKIYIFFTFILIAIIFGSFVFSVRMIFQLRQLDEMKNDFISNMTHEIKTPIATISLACEMLQDPTIESDAATKLKFLSIIGTENKRMKMLVETILQSSKMSNKNFSINLKETDIHKLIENVSKSFEITIANRNGHLTNNLKANPSVVLCDEMHITNLIYNLVDNAIKYSPKDVDITIETSTKDNAFVLSVSDKGQGINKEYHKHIFEKFYRVPNGDVHNVKGFGIGLNYVAQVVKLHHGTINVISEVGTGSTFIITLPQ